MHTLERPETSVVPPIKSIKELKATLRTSLMDFLAKNPLINQEKVLSHIDGSVRKRYPLIRELVWEDAKSVHFRKIRDYLRWVARREIHKVVASYQEMCAKILNEERVQEHVATYRDFYETGASQE